MLRIKVFPLRYFRWCGYFRGLWVSFVITGEFLVRVTEIISRIGVSWTHSLQLRFLPFFDSKVCKSDNFQSDSSVKLSFTSIRGLHLNFVRCESFLESNCPGILALFLYVRRMWMAQLILAISLWEVIFFNPKGLFFWLVCSCSLCKGGTSFAWDPSLENS